MDERGSISNMSYHNGDPRKEEEEVYIVLEVEGVHGLRPNTKSAHRRRTSGGYRSSGGSRGSGRPVPVGRP